MKKFDADKTRMIGLPYGEKNYNDMLSRFHPISERNGRTDRQTDRQTDRFAISISRVTMLTGYNVVTICLAVSTQYRNVIKKKKKITDRENSCINIASQHADAP